MWILLALKELMFGSKKYPYLPHGRDFSLDPHWPLALLEIPVKLCILT